MNTRHLTSLKAATVAARVARPILAVVLVLICAIWTSPVLAVEHGDYGSLPVVIAGWEQLGDSEPNSDTASAAAELAYAWGQKEGNATTHGLCDVVIGGGTSYHDWAGQGKRVSRAWDGGLRSARRETLAHGLVSQGVDAARILRWYEEHTYEEESARKYKEGRTAWGAVVCRDAATQALPPEVPRENELSRQDRQRRTDDLVRLQAFAREIDWSKRLDDLIAMVSSYGYCGGRVDIIVDWNAYSQSVEFTPNANCPCASLPTVEGGRQLTLSEMALRITGISETASVPVGSSSMVCTSERTPIWDPELKDGAGDCRAPSEEELWEEAIAVNRWVIMSSDATTAKLARLQAAAPTVVSFGGSLSSGHWFIQVQPQCERFLVADAQQRWDDVHGPRAAWYVGTNIGLGEDFAGRVQGGLLAGNGLGAFNLRGQLGVDTSDCTNGSAYLPTGVGMGLTALQSYPVGATFLGLGNLDWLFAPGETYDYRNPDYDPSVKGSQEWLEGNVSGLRRFDLGMSAVLDVHPGKGHNWTVFGGYEFLSQYQKLDRNSDGVYDTWSVDPVGRFIIGFQVQNWQPKATRPRDLMDPATILGSR